MQMVSLTLRIMSRPDTTYLSTIYRSLGLDYDERVLPSIGNEVLKATVAQFDAAELITQREVVSSRIREDLLKRASEFNIILEDVSIVSSCRSCVFGGGDADQMGGLTDSHDVRKGVHSGCRTEASCSARFVFLPYFFKNSLCNNPLTLFSHTFPPTQQRPNEPNSSSNA